MIHPDDPPSSSSRLSTTSKHYLGRGPNRSHRHVHHQRGTIGTFHIRLLEGRNLQRKHWSALGLLLPGGMGKTLGLSHTCGEVRSFGTLRLAFWNNGNSAAAAAGGSGGSGARDDGESGECGNELNSDFDDQHHHHQQHHRAKMEDFHGGSSSRNSVNGIGNSSHQDITNGGQRKGFRRTRGQQQE